MKEVFGFKLGFGETGIERSGGSGRGKFEEVVEMVERGLEFDAAGEDEWEILGEEDEDEVKTGDEVEEE